MARRSDIDWEHVERLYRAGQLTIKQIAEACKVSDSQIRARAKRHGWTRDLSDAIRARTQAKVAAIDVNALVEETAAESAGKSARQIRDAVEYASDVAAGVVVRHRTDIQAMTGRAARIEDMLEAALKSGETSIGAVVRASTALKALIDARAKLIEKERQAFGLDRDEVPDRQPVTELSDEELYERAEALHAKLRAERNARQK